MNANEELYRRIVDAVPEGIWVVSPQGGTIFCNKRMAEILGTDLESLEKLSCFDSVFPEDLGEAQRHFGLQISGCCQPFDFRLRRIDGSAIWVNISCKPMFDDQGVCTGLLGLFSDISERRRVEVSLRASEAQIKEAQRLAKVGSWERDLTTGRVHWSEEMLGIFGRTDGSPSNFEEVLTYIHPADRKKMAEFEKKIRSAEGTVEFEYRMIRADGERRFVRATMEVIRDDQGTPVRITGAAQDITEQVESEALLMDRNARLQESECSLRQLSEQLIGAQEDERRRIARDLHDDLSQQMAYLGISLSKIKRDIPASMERVRGELSKAQNRLMKLSTGLQNIAHKLHPGLLERLGLVAALKSHFKDFRAVTSMPIVFQSDCQEPVASDVALCVYRIAQESLRNAANHSCAGKVRVNLSTSGNVLLLTISDDGIGFDVQEALRRGGLGLRSMSERARIVHGNIEVKSQPGSGTTVAVTIELRRSNDASVPIRTAAGSGESA